MTYLTPHRTLLFLLLLCGPVWAGPVPRAAAPRSDVCEQGEVNGEPAPVPLLLLGSFDEKKVGRAQPDGQQTIELRPREATPRDAAAQIFLEACQREDVKQATKQRLVEGHALLKIYPSNYKLKAFAVRARARYLGWLVQAENGKLRFEIFDSERSAEGDQIDPHVIATDADEVNRRRAFSAYLSAALTSQDSARARPPVPAVLAVAPPPPPLASARTAVGAPVPRDLGLGSRVRLCAGGRAALFTGAALSLGGLLAVGIAQAAADVCFGTSTTSVGCLNGSPRNQGLTYGLLVGSGALLFGAAASLTFIPRARRACEGN